MVDGIVNGTDFTAPPVDTINVNNLTADIAPAAGSVGIGATTFGVGEPLTFNVDTGAFQITTTGVGSALLATTSNTNSPVVANVSGRLSTAGGDAEAILIETVQTGSPLTVTNNAQITTLGDVSSGISVDGQRDNSPVNINNNGAISTAGDGAHGILVKSGTISGTGSSGTVTNTANVTMTGPNSDGVRMEIRTTASGVVNHTSGTIQGGSGTGSGVHLFGITGLTTQLNNSATVTALSGVAVLGRDSNDTVNNAGTITGAINLGNGNDTLIVQPGSTITGVSDGEAGNDTLTLGGTGSGTFNLDTIGGGANQFVNFETFAVGSGTWSFTGTTTLPFAINGGTIGGNATFGNDVTLNAGSTLAPGDSIGTVTVSGNLVLSAGSTFLVEVSPTAADQVIVGPAGTVTINGATLNVVELPGSMFTSTAPLTFVVIDNQSAGAVAGTGFGTINNSLAFSSVTATSTGGDGNDVAITVTPIVTALVGPTTGSTVTFASVAQTRNQFSVASALDNGLFSGGIANTDEQEVATSLLGLSATSARNAYDLMSGEAHAAVSEALLTHGRDVTDALSRRGAGIRFLDGIGGADGSGALGYAALSTDAASVSRFGLAYLRQSTSETHNADFGPGPDGGGSAWGFETWATGIGRVTDIDATTGAASIDQSAFGFLGGVDLAVWSGLRAGLAAGYSHLNVDVDARASEADIDSGSIAAYASYVDRGFHLFGSASYSYNAVDTDRTIAFGGLRRAADADYTGHLATLYTEGGYTFRTGPAHIQPVAAARFTHLSRESFSEGGAGSLNLIASSESDNRFDAIAGVRIASSHALNGVTIVPQAKVFYTHSFGAVQGDADFTFSGGGALTGIVASSRGRDALTFGLGASLIASETLSGFVDYQANLTRNTVDNAFRGGITIKF